MSFFYNKHKHFLQFIGLKDSYIDKFLNSLTNNDLYINNDSLLFTKYLIFYQNYINDYFLDDKFISLKHEHYLLELIGFKTHIAYYYVSIFKDICLYDSTINWIYRIIESYINFDGYVNLNKFITKCKTHDINN